MAPTPDPMTDDRLRCHRGGEWKERKHYSETQLAKYDRKARQGTANPASSGAVCKEHSPQGPQKLKCQGPCRRTRELQFFSKNTRKKGTNWCFDCTDYQRTLEVGASLPAPNSQRSLEETASNLSPYPTLSNNAIYRPRGGDDEYVSGDDDSSDLTSTLSQSEQHGSTIGTSMEDSAIPTTGDKILDKHIPPHLRGPMPAPHWLLPNMDEPFTVATESSAASVDRASDMSDGMLSPVTPGAPPVSFNAWGPNGEYSRMVKTPTVASSSAYTSESRKTVRAGRSGWAKPPTRKYPPQLPDYLKNDEQVEEDVAFSDGSADSF